MRISNRVDLGPGKCGRIFHTTRHAALTESPLTASRWWLASCFPCHSDSSHIEREVIWEMNQHIHPANVIYLYRMHNELCMCVCGSCFELQLNITSSYAVYFCAKYHLKAWCRLMKKLLISSKSCELYVVCVCVWKFAREMKWLSITAKELKVRFTRLSAQPGDWRSRVIRALSTGVKCMCYWCGSL